MMAALARKLRSAAALPGFVKLWVLPVWVLLGLARLAVMFVPFRRMAPHFGAARGPAAEVPLASEAEERRARLIGQTIRLAARYAPWAPNCFPRAITACVLLRLYRVPYALFFGLRRGKEDPMDAHAWTAAGRVSVTGGWGFDSFTVVGTFLRHA